jgi:hypothetical protein
MIPGLFLLFAGVFSFNQFFCLNGIGDTVDGYAMLMMMMMMMVMMITDSSSGGLHA